LVSENFLNLANGWNHSMFDRKLGCIAGCFAVKDSSGFRVEEGKYIIVDSNELVQVRHLLLFEGEHKKHNVLSKVCFLVLFLYVVMLVILGLWKTQTFRFWLRSWFRN